MTASFFTLIVVLLLSDYALAGEPWFPEGPTTVTPSGRIRGSWMETRRGRRFHAYRGIRYTEPPVGPLRFQPPKLILHYDGEVNATADGPACPQPTTVIDPSLTDEDCLTINVYTPVNTTHRGRLLPVIVYFHAGAFVQFSGRSVEAGPNYLLDHDLVFVAFNYRIGSLGFLAMGTAQAPGNNGFKDQVAALKWVRRNIASFGGDPNLVTIAGCSAGSLSVINHMISAMSTGLFHRVIAVSGSPAAKVPSPNNRYDLAVKQAKIVNCTTESPEKIFACLNTKTGLELAGDLSGFKEFGTDPQSLWRSVVEHDFGQERFLAEEPITALRAGARNSVPIIVSQTRDEFFWKAFTVLRNETLRTTLQRNWNEIAPISFIVPRVNTTSKVEALRAFYLDGKELSDDADISSRLGKVYGDAISGFPVHRLANLLCRHNKHPVWYYEFDYIGNNSFYIDPRTNKPAGVAHQDDLIYLLSMPYKFPPIPFDESEDSHMVDKMTAIWFNFARTGNPNPLQSSQPVTWPRMSPCRSRHYLKISSPFSVHRDLKKHRYQLWDRLYPIQY